MPKLTAAGVRSAKPGSHSDGNGLILRVFPTGGKRWVWRGTVQGRRRGLWPWLLPDGLAQRGQNQGVGIPQDCSDGRRPLRSPVSGSDPPAGCREGHSTSPGQMETRRPIRGAMEVVPRQLCVPTSRQQNSQQRHHPRRHGLPGLPSGIPDPQRPGGPSSGFPPLCGGASLTVTEQTTRRTTESQPPWGRTPNGLSTSSPYTTAE